MTLTVKGRYIVAIASSYAAGVIGSRFMSADWQSWYETLVKPPFMPPSWVFLPVWLILYALMGVALGALWSKAPMWNSWTGLFYVSLALNAAWSLFFFGLHTIFIALVDILCLALLLITLTLTGSQTDARAVRLLIPYLLWVLFAAYLNAGIWFLN